MGEPRRGRWLLWKRCFVVGVLVFCWLLLPSWACWRVFVFCWRMGHGTGTVDILVNFIFDWLQKLVWFPFTGL